METVAAWVTLDGERGVRREGIRASWEDLLGGTAGFPVPAEEVLSVSIDQMREVLVRNTLRGPPGRTFLWHSGRISKSLEERTTHTESETRQKQRRRGEKPCQ